jgi:hypothetical protein
LARIEYLRRARKWISLVDGQALNLCERFATAGTPDFSWDEWENIKHVAEPFA